MTLQTVRTPDYNIVQGNIQESLKTFLASTTYSKICIIMDTNTRDYCLPKIESILPDELTYACIEPGEKYKTLESCQFIWNKMIQTQLDRNSLVINIGGGVIGDMGGFCASTYKRGVRFIQIPTTLLSQVDASVGGKLGIDFGQIKNSIGLFCNPEQVLLDSAFFNTLPEREIRSGFAEVIKHALIADKNAWATLQDIKDLSTTDWSKIIYDSVQIKRNVVVEDPFEKGLRKALNFGHTIGHAVESVYLEKENHLLHGEAIAIGMICESYASHVQTGLSQIELEAISAFLLQTYGKVALDKSEFATMLSIMKNDKKNRGNEINCSLLPTIGTVEVNHAVPEALILESLDYYNQL